MQECNDIILNRYVKDSQNINEFIELLNIYKKINANYILEIGSLLGGTLQHWIKFSNKGSTVISIDLPVRNFVGPNDPRVEIQEYNYKNVWPKWAKENQTKLYLIPDMSQNINTLQSVKTILSGNKIDFLFIDGNHMYEAIKTDFEMYSPLVKGIVAFHDIAINEEGGGSKYWNEIKYNYSNKEILLDSNKEKGIGVLFL